MKTKTGRTSNKDIQYIKDHLYEDPAKIAEAIGKTEDVIKRWVYKIKTGSNEKPVTPIFEESEYDIKTRPFWVEIKKQFTEEEQGLFIYHWQKTVEQFKDDVLHTEELQIVDLIKLEILCNRELISEKQARESLNTLRLIIDMEKEKDLSDRNLNLMADTEKQIGVIRQSLVEYSKNYQNLLSKKDKLLSEIKGTRNQRIEKLEDSKITVMGWMKQLISDRDTRMKIGEEIEKMRLATYKELLRLAQNHKYDDGNVDQPFLTPETIELLETMIANNEVKNVQEV